MTACLWELLANDSPTILDALATRRAQLPCTLAAFVCHPQKPRAWQNIGHVGKAFSEHFARDSLGSWRARNFGDPRAAGRHGMLGPGSLSKLTAWQRLMAKVRCWLRRTRVKLHLLKVRISSSVVLNFWLPQTMLEIQDFLSVWAVGSKVAWPMFPRVPKWHTRHALFPLIQQFYYLNLGPRRTFQEPGTTTPGGSTATTSQYPQRPMIDTPRTGITRHLLTKGRNKGTKFGDRVNFKTS